MRLGRIFLVLIGLAVIYFGALNLGLLGSSLENVSAIDSQFGIGTGKLAPGSLEELARYESELKRIPAGGKEKQLIDLKLELVAMQRATLSMAEKAASIDFTAPNCAPSGPVIGARTDAEAAHSHAERALELKRALGSDLQGFEYIASAGFDSTLGYVKESLAGKIEALKTLC